MPPAQRDVPANAPQSSAPSHRQLLRPPPLVVLILECISAPAPAKTGGAPADCRLLPTSERSSVSVVACKWLACFLFYARLPCWGMHSCQAPIDHAITAGARGILHPFLATGESEPLVSGRRQTGASTPSLFDRQIKCAATGAMTRPSPQPTPAVTFSQSTLHAFHFGGRSTRCRHDSDRHDL